MASARFLLLVVSASWALAQLLPEAAAATTHIVGGRTGWTIPPDPNFYATWAANQTYAVGDSLVFNFPTGQHNVQRVAGNPAGSCGTSKPIGPALNDGPATVKLTEAGSHYYICLFPAHCDAGQMLAINVTAKATTTPKPPSPTAPAPAPTGASSSPGGPSGSSMPAAPKSGSLGSGGSLAMGCLAAWLAVAYAVVLV